MERLITKLEDKEEDKQFGAILHGDYNRNNVLFKYKPLKENEEKMVENIKLIDFQVFFFSFNKNRSYKIKFTNF